MNIQTALNAILAELQADATIPLIANKTEIRLHAGKFTWAELKARSFAAPALFISCLGWQKPREEPTGFSMPQHVFDVRFVAGIVAKSAKGSEARNAIARAIAEQFTLHLLSKTTWGQIDIAEPDNERVRAEGLFVPDAEAENQSLWIVSWYQLVQFDPAGLPLTLEDFGGFDTDHMKPGAESGDAPQAQTSDTY